MEGTCDGQDGLQWCCLWPVTTQPRTQTSAKRPVPKTDADQGGSPADEDCDDGEPSVTPDAIDVGNGADDDFDDLTDDDDESLDPLDDDNLQRRQ